MELESLEVRRLLSAAGQAWQIHGDVDRKNLNDVITVQPSAADPSVLEAMVDGKLVGTRKASNLHTIIVHGGRGSDQISVNVGAAAGQIRVREYGGAGNDTLACASGNDTLVGGAGNNLLFGSGNHARLVAGAGRDTLRGGAGHDTLVSGVGRDVLYINATDTIIHHGRKSKDVVLDMATQQGFTQFQTMDDFKQWVIEAAVNRWRDSFGQRADWWYRLPIDNELYVTPDGQTESMPASPLTTAAPATASAIASNPDHSTTNAQEQGVGEADLTETDGQNIYSITSGQLSIVSAAPADQMKVLSQTAIDGSPQGMYLIGSKVAVLSYVYSQILPPWGVGVAPTSMIASRPYFLQPKMKLTLLDVTDATAPKISQETTLDGRLIDSREVGGRIYVVVDNGLPVPPPDTVKNDGGTFYESEDAYRAQLASLDLTTKLPTYTTHVDGQDDVTGQLVALPNLYLSGADADNQDLTSVVTFDLNNSNPGPDGSTTIVGPSGDVYASTDSLYITGWSWDENTGQVMTDIARFSLDNDVVTLDSVGQVDGSVESQFALSEFDGDLRIATTSWSARDESTNNVFVLAEDGTNLDTVGSLTDLSPGETIYAARFIGDQAYLSTFKQVDPLLSIDLSDPTDPKVVGKLELPGFSSYLQPVGDHFLLGLGHDADSSGHVGSLDLSLFNIADPSKPALVQSYKFEGSDPNSSTGSAAEYDPHAIQVFQDQNLIALPVWKYDDVSGDYVEGMDYIKLDTASGFSEAGFITQDGAERALRIGSTIYSVSPQTIDVVAADDPSQVIGTVTIGQPSTPAGTGGGVNPGGPIITGGVIDPDTGTMTIIVDPTTEVLSKF